MSDALLSVETYEIGRYYRVPVVEARLGTLLSQWPVIGPRHEDAEFINFPDEHYHLDYRFLTLRQKRFLTRLDGDRSIYTHVLHLPPLNPLGLRLRKCRQVYPQYPGRGPRWLKDLSAAFKRHRLGEGLICPHRGASLRGLDVQNGCITCPLHGLKWDLQTRKCVPPDTSSHSRRAR